MVRWPVQSNVVERDIASVERHPFTAQQRGDAGKMFAEKRHRRIHLRTDLRHPVLYTMSDPDAHPVGKRPRERIGTGSTPTPTVNRVLCDNAIAAAEMPPARKQSSQSQSSSSPASSAARAVVASRSGANCARYTHPTRGRFAATRWSVTGLSVLEQCRCRRTSGGPFTGQSASCQKICPRTPAGKHPPRLWRSTGPRRRDALSSTVRVPRRRVPA